MKIGILTSGILPIPAVQGGAVENLVDFYLEYNDIYHLHDITIYSVWHPDVKRHPSLESNVNHYRYIKTDGLWAKFRMYLNLKTKEKEYYYHHSIEYYLEQTLKHIKKQHYDLILIENRPGYALKLRNITDAPIVYHLHNNKLDNKSMFAKEIYDAATRIITVSDYIASCVRTINRTINNQDDKCITIHNGINLSAFSPNVPSFKESLFNSDDFILVFSGRMNREKGIMELIDAVALLYNYQNIKLLVIGSSFYGNANNENSFTRTLKEKASHLKDRIIFTGFVPYNDMPDYLHIADVAVIPSIWDDPFPTTVLEAQAIGLPIITTQRGGIPEEVTEENAILLNTDEHFVDNLASAILDLYQQPEKRKRMSEASLKRSRLFDKETYAKNFFAALEG